MILILAEINKFPRKGKNKVHQTLLKDSHTHTHTHIRTDTETHNADDAFVELPKHFLVHSF